jgi:hypothetical protein
MGNEGSVPQQGVEDALDEQLEYQAKAPPSATNPPPHSQLSNGGPSSQQQSSQINSGGGASSGGGKGRLMGSVFTRRGNAHNQNSTGIERTVEVAASYPPSHYSNSTGNGATPSVVPMPGEELTYMGADQAGGYFAPQQPQQRYNDGKGNPYDQHGPPPPQQPVYMQQQQSQPHHVMPNQQYYQQQAEHASLRTSTKEEDRTVGVMYSQSHNHSTSERTAAAAANAAQALSKKSRRAGAGLISSMRNLSLGFGNSQSPGRPSKQQQVNEWETRWDEDEDDEEEEEEDEADKEGDQEEYAQSQPSSTIRPPPPLHPQMRPDMDSGFASAASAAAAQMSSPMPTAALSYQQQQQQVPFVSPQPGAQPYPKSYAPTPPTQKAHLVTATPDTPAAPPQDDDGVEWDTGMPQGDGQQLSDKPSVEQFLPLLRVLGKGSFGKVSKCQD